MWFLVVLAILFVAFIGVLTYFFLLGFVKQNLGDTDDLDAPVNIPLKDYKEIIAKGIEYVNTEPHKWVYTVSFDGLKLAARYYDNKSDTTVIMFHGYRSSAARDFSCAVKMYVERGYNVLLCDQRSHGRSEGKIISFGIKESRDVLTWVELATEHFGAKKIILSGLSMGASTVLYACEHGLPDTVKAITADCGFTSPVDIINKVAKKNFKINAKPFLPFLNIFCLVFGGFSVYKTNTSKAIKNCDIPILFIHGKSDDFVPCEMTETAFKCANSKSKILLVEGAGHGLSFLVDTELVIKELFIFIDECLK